MAWIVYDEPPEVIPMDDMREHEPGVDCWCDPFWYEQVLVHNSKDGREYYERGERLVS
jgi:hypothetical protein